MAGLAGAQAPSIELYTIGRGEALFNKFGHVALCVVGPEYPGGGPCYNYGSTDFSRPIGLSWEVVRGRAEFWVAVSDRVSMIDGFRSQDRTVYRQILPLDEENAEQLARNLAIDAASENRAYIYNHYLENCSTRPRDLIDSATGGALREGNEPFGTFRELALPGLASFHWTLVPATDWIMGRWVDGPIGTYEAMFLPRILRDTVEQRLDARPSIVYERRAPLEPPDVAGVREKFWVLVAGFVFMVGIGIVLGSPLVSRFTQRLAALALALPGLLLLLAAVVSGLPELRVNELLLVLVPLDLLFLSTRDRIVRFYASLRLLGLIVVALLLFTGTLVQPLWPFWLLAFGVTAAIALKGRRA